MTQPTSRLDASTSEHATTNTMLTIPAILDGQFGEFRSPSQPLLLLPMTAMVMASLLIGYS